MAHGGYGKRRVSTRRPVSRRSKGFGIEKKPKSISLKNQIRSIERILRKSISPEVREVQEKKLEELKRQQEIQTRLAVERRMFLRDRKIKFLGKINFIFFIDLFERRMIERRIRRLERQYHRTLSSNNTREAEIASQLSKLKEDLEYVRFFPKTEKYVSLFIGGDEADMVDRRNRLREQIKVNLIAAAASGKDVEETGSEDDGLLDMSDDDFFLTGSSSDEADADDEWTDKSAREQASSASGKAASGMSSDEKNQRLICARVLMPPPRPSIKSFRNACNSRTRFGGGGASSSMVPSIEEVELSISGNMSRSWGGSSSRNGGGSSNGQTSQSSNLSSNSDAHMPRRKRRPKKKNKLKV
ncbi:hypothetical protein C5167_043934 [Papaver somniferum]|uniref:rRNA-processing protein EFG1 n=1 Tax=Papaver somniferum TaxID=3469 RepID=A0A4Y7LB12_PAPSO|nr:rRNA-processing protein EFG1-like isoform X1 [Papaver somniferum]RZC81359.1 hypothetical protein C5167_043934 [Papaver somniferum]